MSIITVSSFQYICCSIELLLEARNFFCAELCNVGGLFTKAESDLNFNYPINCSVKSTIFRLISYSVYSPAMPEIRLIQLVIFIDPFVK